MEIRVEKVGDWTFQVTVEGRTRTVHTVSLQPDYYLKLTGGTVTPEELVRASFEFLLEREPNTSILSRFDLPVIQHYFPEYEREIQIRLQG